MPSPPEAKPPAAQPSKAQPSAAQAHQRKPGHSGDGAAPDKPKQGPNAARPPGADEGLVMPHERDEVAHATAAVPDPRIVQAKRDIDAGLVDTDMRATPGLDTHRREALVPGPGGKAPSSRT